MAAVDIEVGIWWDAKVNPADPRWVCPECFVTSLVVEWREAEAYCDQCSSHDGRQCPNCGTIQEHVWGSEDLMSPAELREMYRAE